MRYFCGTSDTFYTRNTTNSSDASKTSASVTRLSSHLLGYVSMLETSPIFREVRVSIRVQFGRKEVAGALDFGRTKGFQD